jgi:hypothetical protein
MAIAVELRSERAPPEQVLGACQCSFCRKHNVRAFSDPKASAILTACEPMQVQLYRFGLGTAVAAVCRRCGVYVAMVLVDGGEAFSTINVDALDERALFTGEAVPRDYCKEDKAGRVSRRRARWMPTRLINWPSH